jgi:hypothetical protein
VVEAVGGGGGWAFVAKAMGGGCVACMLAQAEVLATALVGE